MRVAAQRSADAQNSHRDYAFASSSSTVSVTSFASATPPLGERSVPLEAVLGAIDLGLERQADPRVAANVLVRADVGTADLDRVRGALDRELTIHDGLVALDAYRGGLETQLVVALAVEEVRRLQVAGEVLVLHDDRRRIDGSDELGRAVHGHERGVEVLEPAPEGSDRHVLHGEAGRGMDLVELPGTYWEPLLCGLLVEHRHGVLLEWAFGKRGNR